MSINYCSQTIRHVRAGGVHAVDRRSGERLKSKIAMQRHANVKKIYIVGAPPTRMQSSVTVCLRGTWCCYTPLAAVTIHEYDQLYTLSKHLA